MIWIVGEVHSDFKDYLQREAIPYGVFANVQRKPPSGASQVVSIDFTDSDQLLPQLEALSKLNVSGILTAGYENYVIPAAQIALHFNVPGPSLKAAEAARDKSLMRSLFQAYDPSITPEYTNAHDWHEVEAFAKSHGWPLMIKPTNLMKSLHITKNDNLDELRQNYQQTQQAITASQRQLGITTKTSLLVEEFMAGSMHTIEGFADTSGRASLLPDIVDCINANDLGKSDNYVFSRHLPSRLTTTDQAAMLAVAQKGVTALGLTSCPLHIDMMLTPTGPKIIEIGARIGGYRPRIYRETLDVDLYGAAIAIATGNQPDLITKSKRYCAIIELLPDTEGSFHSITNLREVQNLPSFNKITIKAKPGDKIGRASQGYKMTAIITLLSDSETQLQSDYEFIRDSVTVLIRD